ncbi:hypothetical protein IJM86_00545 [bacterium]|nr:hypothetical protein [bacterium]
MNGKKLGLFLGLAAVCGIFAGCNESKDYSFEEALAMTQNKNEVVTDFILNNSAFKGDFDSTLGVKAESDEVALKVKGNFEKGQDDQSSVDIHFDVDGEVEGTKVPVNGDLSFIATPTASYVKLGAFDWKSSDESVAGLVNAFINPLKEQWFKLDLNEIYAQAGMEDFASASKEYMEKYLSSVKEMMDDGMATRLYKSI